MEVRAILLPACAMALLTLIVWVRMLVVRIGEMRRLRIHPQSVATSPQAAQKYVDTRAADNFRNLFELPVLFYAALGVALAIGATDVATSALAWAFVALRALHSAIQCGYNRVMHRFVAYLSGGVVLWLLWGRLAWRLLG
ncbi:MAPEG family protein [Dokdonella sp.]|uniref:MAPEG family protein n=1 Tax=Dokdonella sp. TaxID=2291710 RepID=UPI00260F2420|nr:MAPEG family protein [Dokdonella sp.]